MLQDDLEGQEFALNVLKAHAQKGRLAHTYLFCGEARESKTALALAFACLLNDDLFMQGMDSPVTRKIRSGNHPDIRWLGLDEKERSIKIDEVRELISWASLKPYEGKWKVFVIEGAERLTLEAQNALLKTLEEPPSQTLFCLLVKTKDPLLDTIRSRAFEIRLKPERSPEAFEEGLEGLGRQRWEDFFEQRQALPKDELFVFLDKMMLYFRGLLEKNAFRTPEGGAWLEAIDILYDTKDALDANANTKLAMTRLAVQMKRILPNPQMLKTG